MVNEGGYLDKYKQQYVSNILFMTIFILTPPCKAPPGLLNVVKTQPNRLM